jgi:hypothetical protein
MGQVSWVMRPSASSVQLITLYTESKIQSQPIVPSEMGATHGNRMRNRTSHFPLKSLCIARARMLARTITTT